MSHNDGASAISWTLPEIAGFPGIATWGNVPSLPFMAVKPPVGDVYRGFLHKSDVEDDLRRFLIKNLQPCRIGKERQGCTCFKLEAGFQINAHTLRRRCAT